MMNEPDDTVYGVFDAGGNPLNGSGCESATNLVLTSLVQGDRTASKCDDFHICSWSLGN